MYAWIAAIGIAVLAQDFDYSEHGADWEGLCSTGRSQSPINIQSAVPVRDIYQPVILGNADLVQYNGSVERDTYRVIDPEPASTLKAVMIGDTLSTTFTLNEIHFHSPSEHQIQDKLFDLEMHLVHTNADNAIAVLAVLYYVSSTRSPLLDSIMQGEGLNIAAELGSQINDFYFYSGSMTTPPCIEPISGFLARYGDRVGLPATSDQINWIAGKWNTNAGYEENNRLTQPLNGRTVYEFIGQDYSSFLN